MTFHVVVPDAVDKRAVQILEEHPEFTVVGPAKMSREEALSAVADAHAIIIRSGIQADAELINAAPNLKVIARAGVGVDNVDLATATARGVRVINTPDGNTISTAEHTFGLMLALARHIPQGHQSLKEGRWDRKLFTGVELRGKTLGVVGFGRIGRAVAKRAAAFEMTVIAYDLYPNQAAADEIGARFVTLDELLAESDFITLHTALDAGSENMINAGTIARMKQGVRLVNAARGGLIDDVALAEAIKSGHVAGAALDVFTVEPPPADNPLVGLDGVIHTPHLAASTSDAQINVGFDAVHFVIEALTTGNYVNVVNAEVLSL
jgi:D-3-phosphoglycerate dehydrogenase